MCPSESSSKPARTTATTKAVRASGSRLPSAKQLTEALVARQFVPFYQPLWDVQHQRWEGVETLIRWQHPVQGLLLPDAFIPVAEQSGLILELGAWILHTAFQQMADWHHQGLSNGIVAVNVSALQMHQPDFVEQVLTTLQLTGLAPSSLELELTEPLTLQDTPSLIENMHRFNEMGIRLSIDDFGTGNSSLARLQCCPVTRLKIDKSFVAHMEADSKSLNIMASIITLGHSLNLSVVAEGVETGKQQRLLAQMECNVLQGFHIGIPSTSQQTEVIWHKHNMLNKE